MRRLRLRPTSQEAVTAVLTLTIVLAGLSFAWRGPGSRLAAALDRRAELRLDIEFWYDRIEETNRSFLDGQDGEKLRTLFESEVTIATSFDGVLAELGRRTGEGSLLLRSLTVSPPDVDSELERITFEMELDGSYPSLTTWFRWLEDAYPVFHVDGLDMTNSPESGTVRATVRGALYLPTGGTEAES